MALIKEFESYAAVIQGQFDDGGQPTHPSDVKKAYEEVERLAKLLGWDKGIPGVSSPRSMGKIIDLNMEQYVSALANKD